MAVFISPAIAFAPGSQTTSVANAAEIEAKTNTKGTSKPPEQDTIETSADQRPAETQGGSRVARIKEKIRSYANKWGVSYHLMVYIVREESSFRRTAVGDTHIVCDRTGRYMRSRGPVQISDCYHPQVSDAQAFNWDFSLNFLGRKLAKGDCHEWTTCREYQQLY